MTSPSEQFSQDRYLHHHGRWVEEQHRGDPRHAARHLYALRAHLRHLGWLAPEYDQPGYGVR